MRGALLFVACVASAVASHSLLAQQLPGEPAKQFGSSITGVFEGWYDNPDGSHSFLVGYLNRNRSKPVDLPIGPNNRIEPGGPDMGQPEHFLPGRKTGMFVVTVPKSFTTKDRLVWTISLDGQTTSIPLWMHTDYNITPLSGGGQGRNTPPVLRFTEGGSPLTGPAAILGRAEARSVSIAQTLPLDLWIEDDMSFSNDPNAPLPKNRPPITLTWTKFRGPATVTFDPPKPNVGTTGGEGRGFRGKGTTRAKFEAPGDYVLHVTANDFSGEGGGGFQCCWTTALVKVSVR